MTKLQLLQAIYEPSKFDLHDLFKIRDALMILAYYGLEDKDLLTETLQAIEERVDA